MYSYNKESPVVKKRHDERDHSDESPEYSPFSAPGEYEQFQPPTDLELKQNDKIYNRLKNISSSAQTVNKNLNMGGGEIAARAGINILSTAVSGAINFGMGMVVPGIGVASAALAGITGTAAGDAVNTVLQKMVGSDLTQTLDIDSHLPGGKTLLRDFAKANIKPRVFDYSFAMLTQNSFPYAVSETRDASSAENFVSRNISDASNLTYGRGQLAQRAYQDTKTLLAEVDQLEIQAFKNVGRLPGNAHLIAGETMTKSALPLVGKKRMTAQFVSQVRETRNSLEALQDDALKIGYPMGWLLRHGDRKPDVYTEPESRYERGLIPRKTQWARSHFFATWDRNFSKRK